ncbi:Hypothetical predicted protein, partial [Pelobates cultripes]
PAFWMQIEQHGLDAQLRLGGTSVEEAADLLAGHPAVKRECSWVFPPPLARYPGSITHTVIPQPPTGPMTQHTFMRDESAGAKMAGTSPNNTTGPREETLAQA